MTIYILFTCDAHKSHSSRTLRGAFTEPIDLEYAKDALIKNEVVDYDKETGNREKYFDVVELDENQCELEGSYY